MLLLPAGAKYFTKGFRVAKMRVDYPHNPDWETSFNPEIREILNQSFTYLAKGAQSYVFESQDKKYVIKLFRFKQPSKKRTVERLFNATKIAYEDLREETGLVYAHLNPTQLNLPILHCRDAVGRSYRFHLDSVRFAIQKKGELMKDVLEKAKDKPEEMRHRIDAFLSFLKKRIDKKIINHDSNMTRNFGYLGEMPIEIDFGCYQRDEHLNARFEVARSSRSFRRWLEKQAPEWVGYFDEKSDALVL